MADARLTGLGWMAEAELRGRILPFWLALRDQPRGGYFGAASSRGRVLPSAPKGTVLEARILWTLSSACARWPEPALAQAARAAFDFIAERLWDRADGGVFWSVTPEGEPADVAKHLYAQAFAIYGLSAFHTANGGAAARDLALRLFDLVEDRAADGANGGYLEAFERRWTPAPNDLMGRSEAAKTFNAHFHLLEAYDALHAIAPGERLRGRIIALIERLLGAYDGERHTFIQFFDRDWGALDAGGSNGHDIEAAWLLPAIAARMGGGIAARVDALLDGLTDAVIGRGQDADGGFITGTGADGRRDEGRLWWVQAEALAGCAHAFRRTGEERFLDAAERLWAFIDQRVIDRTAGEWRSRVEPAGAAPGRPAPIASLWKCPYHNGRACLEVIAAAEAAS